MIAAEGHRRPARGGLEDHGDAEPGGEQQQADVGDVLQRIGHRPLGDPLHFLELPGGHEAAGKREEPQQHFGDDRRRPEGGELVRALAEPEIELGRPHQPRREAAEGVGERRPLRHGGEGDPGKRDADGESRDHRDHDPEVVHHLRLGPGGDDRQGHADHAGVDAAARRRRGVQPVQREDEEPGRDEVRELDQVVDHGRGPSPGFCSVLNILSIRSVIRNPLTMLVMDANTAMAPKILISGG